MPAAGRLSMRGWRTVASRALLVLGSLLTAAAILAGLTNREALDAGRFSRHVDAVRMDPSTVTQLGDVITARVLQLDPNLVVVKPLVQVSATSLVRSSAFTPVVTAVSRQLHTALTRPNSGQLVLQLADVGAALVPILRAAVPTLAAALPADFDVTLTRISSQEFAARTIGFAHTIRLLCWLLPLLALLSFLVAIGLSRRRWRALAGVGLALVAASLLDAVVVLVLAGFVRRASPDTLRGAITRAAWHELTESVRPTLIGVAIAGGLIVVVGSGRSSYARLTGTAKQLSTALVRPPQTAAGRAVRVTGLVVLGALLVLRPVSTLTVAAMVGGVALLVLAIGQVRPDSAAASATVSGAVRASAPRRRVGVGAVVVAAVVLAGLAVAGIHPTVGADAAPLSALPTQTCNGFAALCDRRYNDVAFAATHNSMSAADQPGWLFAEQPDGIVDQLDAGIRVLLFDTWLGQPTQRAGIITTPDALRSVAQTVSDRDFGAAAVTAALRARNLVGLKPTGPAQPYLCHGFCEFGSTLWEPVMAQVKDWMVAHPRDVVTFFIQDEGVTPAQTNAVFQQAGLLPFVHTQAAGQPWPTLGQMIDSGQRLVVLMENQDGGREYPWQMPGFTWTQDTPYNYSSADQFSCARLRGSATSPLFLVNHWLSNPNRRVTDSAAVNSYNVLWPRVSECEQQRGQIPNFVVVDFYDEGDLLTVVNRLNGVA